MTYKYNGVLEVPVLHSESAMNIFKTLSHIINKKYAIDTSNISYNKKIKNLKGRGRCETSIIPYCTHIRLTMIYDTECLAITKQHVNKMCS